MKSKFLFYFGIGLSLLLASEDKIMEKYPQKNLNQEQKKLLEESLQLNKDHQSPSPKMQNIKGSTLLSDSKKSSKKEAPLANQPLELENPYAGFKETKKKTKEKQVNLSANQRWIYGTAVITTTFLDGSIKRSYGILLRNGMFVTSANMVYDKNVYARLSYAMMQDDSSTPFICVAKLSIKAFDLQKGLAILETLAFTDMYCNTREKTFYHDRIYSQYWIDVFSGNQDSDATIVYSPYITELNAFATEKTILTDENLGQLAKKESKDFEGYKHAYGKGFYTSDGRLLGIIGASNDDVPKFIKAKEIANFLCELRDRKILQSSHLGSLCPEIKIN